MSIDAINIAQEAIDLIKEKINNLNKLNIIVAGKTGVGKSTLINAVFKDNLAEEGLGKPVTRHMRKISKEGVPLNIYDTKGFELGKDVQEEVKAEIISTINEGLNKNDINEAIHCIWYCINTSSNRVEPEEIEWIRELTHENKTTQVPIIVVLTQSISKKNAEKLRAIIEDENLDIIQVVPVLAKDFEIEDVGTVKSFGLDRLIIIMGHALPEELQDTLQHVQIANLEAKKSRAVKAVAAAALAATGQGAAPIPFADATLLIPTQIAMIASITVIFGFDINKSVITALVSSTLGSGGATLLGRTVVANIIKLVPGAGSIAGGAISAGTAGVITAALGTAYIAIMEQVFKGEMKIEDISTKEGKENIQQIFKENLKNGKENLMKILEKGKKK